MSYVKTVLNELRLAAMPAMNDASSPAMAIPSMPFGSRSRMRSKSALLKVTPLGALPPLSRMPLSWMYSCTETAAIMPGMITMNGTNIFGNAPMMGVRRAADMLFDAMARWTSTKLVVQYPKDSTNPSPNTMPSTERMLLPKPVRLSPGQECSCAVPPGLPVTLSTSPCPAAHLDQADDGQRQQRGDD